MNEKRGLEFLRDSALITTGVAVLLFVWGSSFQSFTANFERLPLAFLPEFTVQQHMMTGGLLAILGLFPLVLLIVVADWSLGGRLRGYVRHSSERPQDAFIFSAVAFAISIGALYLIAWGTVQFGPSYTLRVTSIFLKSETGADQFNNLYYVARHGGNYVFVDHFPSKSPRVSILNVDELRWMTLSSADQQGPTVGAPASK